MEIAEGNFRVKHRAVVFREVATRIMIRDQNLDILSRLPTSRTSRLATTSLPS